MRIVKKKPNQRYLYLVSDAKSSAACLVCAENGTKAELLSKYRIASALYLGIAKSTIDEGVILTFIWP